MKSKLNNAEEWIRFVNDVTGIIQSEQQTERPKRSIIQDLQDNIKHDNQCIIGIPRDGDKGNWRCIWINYNSTTPKPKKRKHIPSYRKHRGFQTRGTPKRPTPRHIIIKMMKIRGFLKQ